MSETPRRIVLVGHCGPDFFALRSAMASMLPGVVVERANDDAGTQLAAKEADLLLINRALDGDFAAGDGVALIRSLAGVRARLMLISNYAESQSEAERAGALPGFGKSAMYADRTGRILRAALGLETAKG
jgi:hypothetical protein